MDAAREFITADLDQARAHMGAVFRSHDLWAAAGRLDMRHRRLRAGPVSVHWLGYGAPVTMTAPEMDRFYLFQFNLMGACEVARGGAAPLTVPAGHGYVVDPERPLRKSWSADCRQFMVRVERDEVERHLRRELNADLKRPLRFDDGLLPVQPRLAALIAYMDAMGDDAAPALRERAGAGALLVAHLLSTFPHNYSDDYARVRAPAPVHVRRAEEFIRGHARDSITLAEIVAAAGVSTRCLYDGFRQFRGTTPMDYLRAVRLDGARHDLLTGDPAATTVTAVALAWGFAHVSKFAHRFRERFGELPSDVLRR